MAILTSGEIVAPRGQTFKIHLKLFVEDTLSPFLVSSLHLSFPRSPL